MIRAWTKGIIATLAVFTALPVVAAPPDPTGVWLLEANKVAVRIYDCKDGLCGRIVWLREPLDKYGRLKRDKHNPNMALRDRPVCGIEVLSGLRPAGHDQWDGGTIYNPQDGKTYAASVRAVAPNTIEVRGYVGLPLFGKTKTLTRAYETATNLVHSIADYPPSFQNGFRQGQVAGFVDVDGSFGEGQFDGPGCYPNQARKSLQRGFQG